MATRGCEACVLNSFPGKVIPVKDGCCAKCGTQLTNKDLLIWRQAVLPDGEKLSAAKDAIDLLTAIMRGNHYSIEGRVLAARAILDYSNARASEPPIWGDVMIPVGFLWASWTSIEKAAERSSTVEEFTDRVEALLKLTKAP